MGGYVAVVDKGGIEELKQYQLKAVVELTCVQGNNR